MCESGAAVGVCFELLRFPPVEMWDVFFILELLFVIMSSLVLTSNVFSCIGDVELFHVYI